ncbi:hypothetical protein L6452_07705 [Arctium lappa]|uniref:Uncharacterized protein n=1 Tax=Arctium lappa TaxID=4217 RepID=A0ACB9ELY3_ARCLA|nr:hypothetical protein L6452_07705 [Arctium lappa]
MGNEDPYRGSIDHGEWRSFQLMVLWEFLLVLPSPPLQERFKGKFQKVHKRVKKGIHELRDVKEFIPGLDVEHLQEEKVGAASGRGKSGRLKAWAKF